MYWEGGGHRTLLDLKFRLLALRMYRLTLDDSNELADSTAAKTIQVKGKGAECQENDLSRRTTTELVQSLLMEDETKQRQLGRTSEELQKKQEMEEEASPSGGLSVMTAWLERTTREDKAVSNFGNRQLRLKFLGLLGDCYELLTKTVYKDRRQDAHEVWLKWGLLLLEEARQLKRKEDFLRVDHAAHQQNPATCETAASLYAKSGSFFRNAIMAARERCWALTMKQESTALPPKRLFGPPAGTEDTERGRGSAELSTIRRMYGPVLDWMESGLIMDDMELAQIIELIQKSRNLEEIHSECVSSCLVSRSLSQA